MKPYYHDDSVTIYHGDCREIVPTLGRFDAVLSDPPWNCGYFGKMDNVVWSEYAKWLGKILDCMSQIADGQAWFLSTKSIAHVAHLFEDYRPFASIKNFSQMTPKSLPNCWDIAFIRSTKYKGNGRNWFLCNTAGMLKDRTAHPTPRTLDVITYILSLHDWGTILDPFAGSGTTGRAAKDLGRKATLIEREERYCEIAAKRMAQQVIQF